MTRGPTSLGPFFISKPRLGRSAAPHYALMPYDREEPWWVILRDPTDYGMDAGDEKI